MSVLVVRAGLVLLFVAALVRNAWVSEDAHITLESDPITLLAIAAGIVAACAHSRARAVAAGVPIALYVAYVVRVGGDYMNGRFLTAPFLCAVMTLACARWAARPRAAPILVTASLAIAIVMPESALRLWTITPPPYGSTARYDVANEQSDFFPWMGLIPMLRGARPTDHPWARLGQVTGFRPHTIVHTNVGLLGYYGGPALHIIDEFAVGDPLLARLPVEHVWATGHYRRPLPAWYGPFLDRCIARLCQNGAVGCVPRGTCLAYVGELQPTDGDAATIRLYRDLLTVTQGPLWSRERLRAIVRLNLPPILTAAGG